MTRFQSRWFHGITREREEQEADLTARGCILPLNARVAFARVYPRIRNSLLVVEGPGSACTALSVEWHASRALLGHHIARVVRAGPALTGDSAFFTIETLVDEVRRDSRTLRLHFECFSPNDAIRAHIGGMLTRLSFRQLPHVTGYSHTLVADLRERDASMHLASLTRRVRQDIGAIAKYPIELRKIDDVKASERMNELMKETMARTGARHVIVDYSPIIELSRDYPALSRLIGLYRTDELSSNSLIAFAWGANHGDHAVYDVGGSSRIAEFKRLSLGYPLLWELIKWAHQEQLAWFDFGGVTEGNLNSEDRLGGISDFKRRFGGEPTKVADEWLLELQPIRSSIASAISRVAARLKAPRSSSSTRVPAPGQSEP